MLNDIIKEQTDKFVEKPILKYFPYMMINEVLYCYTKEQLDTLITTTAHSVAEAVILEVRKVLATEGVLSMSVEKAIAEISPQEK
jgi:hypothetical protein